MINDLLQNPLIQKMVIGKLKKHMAELGHKSVVLQITDDTNDLPFKFLFTPTAIVDELEPLLQKLAFLEEQNKRLKELLINNDQKLISNE